jgi:SAM-dependent methyltransferase
VSAAEERLADDPTSALWGEHRSRYRFAGALFSEPGQRVLDVACGTGFGLAMLRQAGAGAIGIDYSAETLRHQAGVVQADAARLPVQSDAFDLVVSFETIEHVPNAAALVQEIRRVLKPGGRLILSTPNRAFGPPELHTGNPFHVQEFTADELRDLLGKSFADVTLYGQRPSSRYQYVPFLMPRRQFQPRALVWKTLVRLPFGVRNRLALTLTGRPFYPGETDYCFDLEATDGAHALLAVAR